MDGTWLRNSIDEHRSCSRLAFPCYCYIWHSAMHLTSKFIRWAPIVAVRFRYGTWNSIDEHRWCSRLAGKCNTIGTLISEVWIGSGFIVLFHSKLKWDRNRTHVSLEHLSVFLAVEMKCFVVIGSLWSVGKTTFGLKRPAPYALANAAGILKAFARWYQHGIQGNKSRRGPFSFSRISMDWIAWLTSNLHVQQRLVCLHQMQFEWSKSE